MAEEIKITNRNITDRAILAKIGDVSMRWAFAEAIVEDIIAGFLGTDLRHSYVLTTNINISTRFQIVLALGLQRLKDENFERLDAVIKSGIRLAPLRNKAVNGLWCETSDPDVQFVEDYRSRGELKYHPEWFTPDYMDWLTEEVRLLGARLLDFARAFGFIPA